MVRRAYTLIELLVAIAVIAVLAGIMTPAFLMAKERARATMCISNLRQLGTAMFLYVQDYDGGYPYDVGPRFTPGLEVDFLNRIRAFDRTDESNRFDARPIKDLLEPYVMNDGVWYCPSMWTRTLPQSRPGTNYQVNPYLVVNSVPDPGQPHSGPVRESDIARPSSVAVFFDFYLAGKRLHRDGRNAVATDGHVKWQRNGQELIVLPWWITD